MFTLLYFTTSITVYSRELFEKWLAFSNSESPQRRSARFVQLYSLGGVHMDHI